MASNAANIYKSLFLFIDKFMGLLNSTNGRDKLVKLVQYGAKIINHQITLRPDMKDHKYWLDYITRFEASVASGRKVFRFFKFVPGYLAFIRYVEKLAKMKDLKFSFSLVVEILDIIGKLLTANYFLMDQFGWAAKLGILSATPLAATTKALASPATANEGILSLYFKNIFNNERLTQFSMYSNKSWFYSLIFTVAVEFVKFCKGFDRELVVLTQVNSMVRDHSEEAKVTQLEAELAKIRAERNSQFLGFVKNFSDLFVAASFSGYIDLSKQTVGVLGVISALIGAYELWPK